ncbi:MAG TPA: hypothetical protein VMV69_15540 [Pirellulales bacterium]|nr:hypothetical protein [Pirellulales bacterium]
MTVQNVSQIQADHRRWLENALGQPLQDDQQVCIMLLEPMKVPDETTRRRAAESIERTWVTVDKNVRASGITDEEIEAAIDEAMQHVRGRSP